jgi:hypothetical protein
MGKKGPLAIVSPAEFKERTALTLSSRSGTTVSVDKAYENYYATRSPVAAMLLHDRLAEYMVAHGGTWAKCERNVVSGGLMEYIYNSVGPGAMSAGQAAAMDKRAADRIRDIEIPSARFGVLYFLSGIKVDLDVVGSLIEGAGAVGGAVGVGMTTDFSKMGSAQDGVRAVTQAFGKDVKAGQIATGGAAALKGTRAVVDKLMSSSSSSSVPSASWLPTSEAALRRARAGLSETWDANKYLGAAAYAGAGLAAVPVGAVTLLADGALAIKRVAEAVWQKIKSAIRAVCNLFKSAWAARYDLATARKMGELLKMCSVVAIDFIMKNAVPFLGGAVDLGTGLFRTISEAGNRVAAWNDRRNIRLQAGHPEELANAIEHQMSMGIVGGLVDMLKGAAKVSAGVFLPGLGSLVTAVMAGIEWMVKLVSRLSEYCGIDQFLQRARSLYDAEKRRARMIDGVYEPNTGPGGVITNTKEFTAFFAEGCKASPLIPMLTLNSGLGGSLMTMLKLFEDDGSQSKRATANIGSGETREFDRGNAYFTRLKRYSVDYMRKSGFKVSAMRADDKVMAGYLVHATGVGKERESHVAAGTALGRVGAFLKA